jgi:hypothetical protein
MKTGWLIGLFAAALVGASALPAIAQQCDDFNECTTNDMCSDGECTGTPRNSGGTCDDFDDCTINDTCTPDGCMGEPAPVDTTCGGGCGKCKSLSPIPIPGLPLTCIGVAGDAGKACDPGLDLGNCFTGACTIIQPVNIAFCVPAQKVCPDTDGNPCTDNCNFNTGMCQKNAPKCFEPCQACNTGNGECEPANVGASCDDFNDCTPNSRCGNQGFCEAGDPTGPTPTATQVTGPRPSPTGPPVGSCVGDCNDDLTVAINELIIGVNIALGNSSADTCPSFDTNDDGSVAVNELISGVNALLNGCA